MKIFTHIPYPVGEIKAGNARFHALMQLDLHSFDQNNLGFAWVRLPSHPTSLDGLLLSNTPLYSA